uniref:Uncharacterized protein n=1 Tax=Triticum urartu TaxID=4572 RepID=A0A8R7UZS6_TRIUA
TLPPPVPPRHPPACPQRVPHGYSPSRASPPLPSSPRSPRETDTRPPARPGHVRRRRPQPPSPTPSAPHRRRSPSPSSSSSSSRPGTAAEEGGGDERGPPPGHRRRIRATFRGGSYALAPADLSHLVYALARGIDYALSGGDIPKIAGEIPDTLRKVYELRKDPFLQSSVMVLIISCKNACKNKWFQPSDFIDILRMADELSGSFCTNSSEPANDSTVLEIISTVMPRYYPKLKFDRLITSLEAKVVNLCN